MTARLSALHRGSRVRAALDPGREWYRVVRAEAIGTQPDSEGDATPGSTADVYVYEAIGGWFGMTADDFVRDVAGLDVDHIDLHLNSPGGDVFEGVAMANVLRQHRASVTVWVDGLAASAASVVAMAGDEVVMGLGAQMMVHDAWSFAIGDAADMRQTADRLDSVSDSLASTYAARAGGTAAEWRAVMVAERWYTAEQAVEVGLADRVASDEDKGRASGQQVVPGSSSPSWLDDWWDSASAAERHADVVAAYFSLPPGLARTQTPAASAGGSTSTQEGAPMPTLNEALRQRLGVAENADEGTILAALDEALAEQAEPATPPAAAALPEGTVAIERTQLDALHASVAGLTAEAEQRRTERRTGLVAAAVADGRIAPARRDHWAAALTADPEGAEASLAPGLVPVAEVGHDTGIAEDQMTTFAEEELDELAASIGLSKGALR